MQVFTFFLAASAFSTCVGCGDGKDAPRCGNGVLDEDESCERGQLGGETCLTLGYYGGQLACRSDCGFDTSSCELFGRCGDAVVQPTNGEECDYFPPSGVQCQDFYYFGGRMDCAENCKLYTGSCSRVLQIDAGGYTTCALINHGDLPSLPPNVSCWGLNSVGQLGINGLLSETCTLDGTPVECSPTPLAPQGVSLVTAVAVGDTWGEHVCVLREEGTVWCWGSNHMGQLGSGPTGETCGGASDPECSRSPLEVEGLTNVTAIAVGGTHSCALRWDGTVWCWGHNNYFQLGTGQTHETCTWAGQDYDCSRTPVQANTPADVTSIAVGRAHSCALVSDGTLWCWGGAWAGQLGDDGTYEICADGTVTAECRREPVQPLGMDDVAIVGRGGALHQCAVKADRTLWCWGSDSSGQIGDGAAQQFCTTPSYPDIACQPIPAQATGPAGWLAVAEGEEHTCAIAEDQSLWCWGLNAWGQLGLGAIGGQRDAPQQVGALAGGVVDVAAGDWHTCAVAADNTAWCWGRNEVGELGNRTVTDTRVATPVPVMPPDPW